MASQSSPQLDAVGEVNPNQTSYAAIMNPKQPNQIHPKTTLKPVQIIHGEPTITFSMEERHEFVIEEGLHQAVVIKLSHGAPDLKTLRSILPKQFNTKGNCLIGLLAPRQILLRFDLYDDFVQALSRPVNYIQHNGEEHQYRVFPWSVGFNHKEETTMAVVWISLPNLSPDLFAKKSLLSIASAIGKPIAIDKATQIKSRPSAARVKVILDVMEKLPNRIRLQFVDGKTGKVVDVFQEIVYDNLPAYCKFCKHQGHDETICRLILKRNNNNKQTDIDSEMNLKCSANVENYKGDAREILNEKRKVEGYGIALQVGKSVQQDTMALPVVNVRQQWMVKTGTGNVVQADVVQQNEASTSRHQLTGKTDGHSNVLNERQHNALAEPNGQQLNGVQKTTDKALANIQVHTEVGIKTQQKECDTSTTGANQNNVAALPASKQGNVAVLGEAIEGQLIDIQKRNTTAGVGGEATTGNAKGNTTTDAVTAVTSLSGQEMHGDRGVSDVTGACATGYAVCNIANDAIAADTDTADTVNIRKMVQNKNIDIAGTTGNDAAYYAIDNDTRDDVAVHTEAVVIEVDQNPCTIPTNGEHAPEVDGNSVNSGDVEQHISVVAYTEKQTLTSSGNIVQQQDLNDAGTNGKASSATIPIPKQQGDQLTDDTGEDNTSDNTVEDTDTSEEDNTSDNTVEDTDTSEEDTTDNDTAELVTATTDAQRIDDVPIEQGAQNFHSSGSNGNVGKNMATGKEVAVSTVTATPENVTFQGVVEARHIDTTQHTINEGHEKDPRQEIIQQSDNPCVNDGWTVVTKKNSGRSRPINPNKNGNNANNAVKGDNNLPLIHTQVQSVVKSTTQPQHQEIHPEDNYTQSVPPSATRADTVVAAEEQDATQLQIVQTGISSPTSLHSLHNFEKEEEEQMLDNRFKNVAGDADLSPAQRRSAKKQRQRRRWNYGNRWSDWHPPGPGDTVQREQPMRQAKQKDYSAYFNDFH